MKALRISSPERRIESLAEGPHVFGNGRRFRQHAASPRHRSCLRAAAAIDRQRQPAAIGLAPWRPRVPPHHARRAPAACSRARHQPGFQQLIARHPGAGGGGGIAERDLLAAADRRASWPGWRPARSPRPGRSARPPGATAARTAATLPAGSAGYRSPAPDRRCRGGRTAAPRWWPRSRRRRRVPPAGRAASPDRRAAARSDGSPWARIRSAAGR